MLTRVQQNTIRQLWLDIQTNLVRYHEKSFSVASFTVTVKNGRLWWLKQPSNGTRAKRYLTRVRKYISKLVRLVPLKMDPDSDVLEVINIGLWMFDSNRLSVDIGNGIGDDAYSTGMTDSEHMFRFINTRSHASTRSDTAWDHGCQKRIIRSCCAIEPGAVWFVEFIEQAGGTTYYSCEGHPTGFYVLFDGPPTLAEMFKDCDAVIGDSGGSYRLSLREDPGILDEGLFTFDDRDICLRALSERLQQTTSTTGSDAARST